MRSFFSESSVWVYCVIAVRTLRFRRAALSNSDILNGKFGVLA